MIYWTVWQLATEATIQCIEMVSSSSWPCAVITLEYGCADAETQSSNTVSKCEQQTELRMLHYWPWKEISNGRHAESASAEDSIFVGHNHHPIPHICLKSGNGQAVSLILGIDSILTDRLATLIYEQAWMRSASSGGRYASGVWGLRMLDMMSADHNEAPLISSSYMYSLLGRSQ